MGLEKASAAYKKFYKQAIYITFAYSKKTTENKVVNCQFEKLGFLFDSLKENGIRRVVMAGSISRPQFDQSKLDQYTLSIMPKLSAKLVQGDNELFFHCRRI